MLSTKFSISGCAGFPERRCGIGSGFPHLREPATMPIFIPMSVEDHHFRREDRSSLWQRLARHVETHPDDLVIAPVA
jgi:hypothetical protein